MFFKKVSRKKLIISIIVILLIVLGISNGLKKEEPSFDLVEVARGDVIQELWETGKVQKGEMINLGFKTVGEIEEIHVQLNEVVEKGDPLAKLDTRDINIQLQGAKLELASARLNLEKLLAGSSLAVPQLESSRILLESAQEDLENSYEAAVMVLNNSWSQLDEALGFIRDLIAAYVVVYDEDARKIITARDALIQIKEEAKDYWDIARASEADYQEIETALSVMRSSLEEAFDNIESIREVMEDSNRYTLSATDEALFDTLKTSINSSLANVISSQKTIASAKLALETAENEVEASQIDIELYENSIKQAQNKIELYESQLEDAVLRSPFKAQVSAINKRAGEQVMSLEIIVSLLPAVPFEIEADIYEEDIVQVNLGDPVEISLPALPEETFQGEVVFIDETEKIIDGVVYYETKIAFEGGSPEGIKNSMTADIVIEIGKRENVLVIPVEAVSSTGNKATIEVLIEELIEEREVEIGLRGDKMIEVLSGLEEGEKVMVR